MEINIIRLIFIFITVTVTVLTVLLNYLEPYLPILITRTYCYGKFSVTAHQPIVAKLEVPKRWFRHFYIIAAPGSSFVLYLVVCEYLWKGNVHESFIWILDMCLGSSRKPLVSTESTFVASVLVTLHCWKRFYETQYVNIFSDSKMNISHYLLGIIHYMAVLMCIVGESEGFVKGSEGNFSWRRITYFHLISAFILISSSYAQLHANIVLRNLRRNKDGEIDSKIYKIPRGGLFEYVSGALQTTEIIIYMTLSMILWQSSTFHYITLWVLANQIGTAVKTHKWYNETFKNYPKSRKILIPFIF